MPDRIELRGIRVVARHGVNDFEKQLAQPFEIDIDIETDLRTAGASDRVEDTADYGAMVSKIASVVVGEQHELLERVAERIAEEVLSHPRIDAVEVALRKLRPPVPVDLATAGVRIRRP